MSVSGTHWMWGLVLLLPVVPAAAQSGGECAGIADDGERLACYDGLFRSGDGGASASVTLESQQLIPARPTGRAPATITVSCQADVLQVAFGFAGNTMSALGSDTGITLQYDLARARSSTLPVNADNTAILIDNTRDARTFLDGLAGATNLTVRVTPASTRSLSVRFRVDAFAQDVAPVVAACGQ
jgi:type VI secretion system protein VasI